MSHGPLGLPTSKKPPTRKRKIPKRGNITTKKGKSKPTSTTVLKQRAAQQKRDKNTGSRPASRRAPGKRK